LKGSHALSRPALAVLRELWHWREAEAIAANRPPFFILSHEALVDIADAAAAHRSFQPLLPRHFSPRRRTALSAAIETALQLSGEKHPGPPPRGGRRPTEAERHRFRELEKRRDAHAHRLDIDPTLIASRATLSQLAHDWHEYAPGLMSWQRELLQP
jgi:ribonuclease D